jgi:glycerophosphoryl diester phosphodiesterase
VNGRHTVLAKEVIKVITKLDLKQHCFVSSFRHAVLKEIEKCEAAVRTIYLYGECESDELPPVEELVIKGKGVNICSSKVTKEMVRELHEEGILVNVWVDKEKTKEDAALWEKMIELKVDSICTDFPLKVALVKKLKSKPVISTGMGLILPDKRYSLLQV